MVFTPNPNYLLPEDYLHEEKGSPTKHEYVDGQIYAMGGASDAHVTIAGNLFALFRVHLRGKGCRVYISDMKARIESRNIFYYPDVIVTCDARDRETPLYKRYPCLIVEVLSPSTEAFDRGDKFIDYQHLETLEEYVLVSTNRQRVDCFRRNAEGLWVLRSFLAGDMVHFASISFETSLEAVYEDAVLSEPNPNR